MTRTQKLNLFTWALNDPVDLDQMNENFDRLDQSGRAAEAALWNSGILLMDGARSGENTAAAEDLTFNLLTAPGQAAAYSRVKFSASGAAVPTAGQANFTKNIDGQSISRNSVNQLAEFQPDGYGTLTSVALAGSSIYHSGTVLHMQLCRGETVVAEATADLPDSGSLSCSFSFSSELDPNLTYQLICYGENVQTQGLHPDTLTVNVTPIVPSSGSVTSAPITVPDWAKRAKLLFRGGSHTLTAEYSLSGENWNSLTLEQSQSGAGRSFISVLSLPDGTQTMRLRVTIPAGGKLGDYMVVFY